MMLSLCTSPGLPHANKDTSYFLPVAKKQVKYGRLDLVSSVSINLQV
jgi:hypothetical protein